MTTPPQTSITVDEYVRQVEQAFADLPPQTRHHLLADLDTHLRDQASVADLVDALGTPVQYAHELRTALDLPTSSAPVQIDQRRWLVPALIAGLVAAAVLATVALIVAVSSASPNRANDAALTPVATAAAPSSVAPTVTPSSLASTVTLPSVVGRTQVSATVKLLAAGLAVSVQRVHNAAVPIGRVVAQLPAASSVVVVGTRVTLKISTG